MTTPNDETRTGLQRFHGDAEYFDAHHQEFLDRYPEQWVAVYDRQVVGADADFYTLLDELKAKGVPLEKAVIERVTREEEVWIFAAA